MESSGKNITLASFVYQDKIESFKNSTKNLIYLQDRDLNLFSSHSNFLKDLIGLS